MSDYISEAKLNDILESLAQLVEKSSSVEEAVEIIRKAKETSKQK